MVRISLILGLVSVGSQAQTIDNLQHQPFGDEVVITYDLNGTLPSQQFLVRAVCQNGSQTVTLQHTEGNGLGRVRGGQNRQIVWHVLDDAPELVGDKVTFTITALLMDAGAPEPLTRGSAVVSTADRKAALYNELTAQIDTYLEQVFNEVTAFKNFGERAFESRTDLLKLDQQIQRTNNAYEKLLENKESTLR